MVNETTKNVEKFDIYFNDGENSNNMGFTLSYDECISFIEIHNSTNHIFFESYKGGTVSIVGNDTDITVYEVEVI